MKVKTISREEIESILVSLRSVLLTAIAENRSIDIEFSRQFYELPSQSGFDEYTTTGELHISIDVGLAKLPERVNLQSLDSKGRCCGRKPLEYKRYGGHHFFCPRCNREYDPITKKQRANWAYDSDGKRIASDI